MTKTCGDCIYFDSTPSYCRRNSPLPELTGNPKVVWPQVDPVNDWCADGWNYTDGAYNRQATITQYTATSPKP